MRPQKRDGVAAECPSRTGQIRNGVQSRGLQKPGQACDDTCNSENCTQQAAQVLQADNGQEGGQIASFKVLKPIGLPLRELFSNKKSGSVPFRKAGKGMENKFAQDLDRPKSVEGRSGEKNSCSANLRFPVSKSSSLEYHLEIQRKLPWLVLAAKLHNSGNSCCNNKCRAFYL